MKRRIAAIVFAIAFVFAGTIGVSAVYSEIDVLSVGMLRKHISSQYLYELSLNESISFYDQQFGFYVETTLQLDALYHVQVDIHTSNYYSEFTDFPQYIGISLSKPNMISVLTQKNSENVYFKDLINVESSYTRESSSSWFYHFDIYFSTSPGLVDNFSPGSNYITLIFPDAMADSYNMTYLGATVTAYEDVPEDVFQSFVTSHLTQVVNNQSIIIHYGSGNALPQESGLGAAQSSLHQAEDDLKGKSQSLVSKASSGVSKALAASQTHLTALAAPVAAVGSTVSTAMEQLPEEVQSGFLAMPLLGFAAWLIGLKR